MITTFSGTIVAGVPNNVLESGTGTSLLKGVQYEIVGYMNVPARKGFQAWTGVGVRNLSTGAVSPVSRNTLQGIAIYFDPEEEDASDKGYILQRIEDNPFTSVEDFAASKNEQGEIVSNGTIFEVTDYVTLKVNKVFRPLKKGENSLKAVYESLKDEGEKKKLTATRDKRYFDLKILKKVGS